MAEGQPFVVEAQQVQDRGVEVVDVDGVLGDVDAVFVGRAVGRCRALTPPPASQDEKAQWWCSRPLASGCSLYGVRPNSVVHTTSVSSSMPRCFRSVSRPAMG